MNEIIDKINTKHYEDAFSQFEKHFELLKDPFEVETYENRTGNLFEFVVVAGEMSKKADIVYFCSMILATSLNCFENAYSYSYGFAKKLIRH